MPDRVAQRPAAPLRVLISNDRLGYETGLHGAGRFLIWATQALLDRGIEVTPVVLRVSDNMADHPRSVDNLPFVFLQRHEFDPRTVTDLVHLIRDRGIQVAHLQGYGASTFGRIAALRCGIPALVHVHADYRLAQKGYSWYVRAMDRALARRTPLAIAVSSQVRQFAIEAQGFDPTTVQVLHNPVDRSVFRAPSETEKTTARLDLGIGSEEKVAVFVGRLDHLKGVDVLLSAWSQVQQHVPYARLIIVGGGPLEASLREAVTRGSPSRFSRPWRRAFPSSRLGSADCLRSYKMDTTGRSCRRKTPPLWPRLSRTCSRPMLSVTGSSRAPIPPPGSTI